VESYSSITQSNILANSSQKVRDFLTANPNVKPADVAKKFGINNSYVYVLRSQLKKQFKVHPGPVIQEPAPAPAPDMVNKPPHYTDGGIEVIDFIEAKGLDYHLGNVIKYVSRAGKKAGALEDLKKAQWYLTRAIERHGV
jgi:Protein of unknwon function (DUF3310)